MSSERFVAFFVLEASRSDRHGSDAKVFLDYLWTVFYHFPILRFRALTTSVNSAKHNSQMALRWVRCDAFDAQYRVSGFSAE